MVDPFHLTSNTITTCEKKSDNDYEDWNYIAQINDCSVSASLSLTRLQRLVPPHLERVKERKGGWAQSKVASAAYEDDTDVGPHMNGKPL